MKRTIIFFVALTLSALTLKAQTNSSSNQPDTMRYLNRISVDGFGKLQVATVLDILYNDNSISPLAVSSLIYKYNKGELDSNDMTKMQDLILQSRRFKYTSQVFGNPDSISLYRLFNANNRMQRDQASSLNIIANCAIITTSTMIVGIIGTVIYAIAKKE